MPGKCLGCLTLGANLDKCVSVARELGIEVTSVRRTGEIRFTHADMDRSIRVNRRRKDAPLAVIKFINEVWRKHQAAA
jgi:hypothetical protein